MAGGGAVRRGRPGALGAHVAGEAHAPRAVRSFLLYFPIMPVRGTICERRRRMKTAPGQLVA